MIRDFYKVGAPKSAEHLRFTAVHDGLTIRVKREDSFIWGAAKKGFGRVRQKKFFCSPFMMGYDFSNLVVRDPIFGFSDWQATEAHLSDNGRSISHSLDSWHGSEIGLLQRGQYPKEFTLFDMGIKNNSEVICSWNRPSYALSCMSELDERWAAEWTSNQKWSEWHQRYDPCPRSNWEMAIGAGAKIR